MCRCEGVGGSGVGGESVGESGCGCVLAVGAGVVCWVWIGLDSGLVNNALIMLAILQV